MALGLFEGPCQASFKELEGLGGKREFGGTCSKSSLDTQHASSSSSISSLMYSSSCELRDLFSVDVDRVVSSIALGQPEFDFEFDFDGELESSLAECGCGCSLDAQISISITDTF
jgi:hypothetical protein